MKTTITPFIATIFILLSFIGCNLSESNLEIRVLVANKHPTRIDHYKKIAVFENGKLLSQLYTYMDSGSGCESNMYETKDYFLLIECNGTHYAIHKKDGKIENVGWEWLKEPKGKFLGTYEFNSLRLSYTLVERSEPELETIYKFKDPKNNNEFEPVLNLFNSELENEEIQIELMYYGMMCPCPQWGSIENVEAYNNAIRNGEAFPIDSLFIQIIPEHGYDVNPFELTGNEYTGKYIFTFKGQYFKMRNEWISEDGRTFTNRVFQYNDCMVSKY